MPWSADGIYLQDKNKQVKAVCSNDEIAKILASCVWYYAQVPYDKAGKIDKYKKFLQAAYYLYVALGKAKIPVNTLETAIVEKAYGEYCTAFMDLLKTENFKIVERKPDEPQTVMFDESKSDLTIVK